MLVGRVAEGAEIGIVRRFDPYTPPQPDEAVKLFHRANDVGEVLDHMNSTQAVEGTIGERVGKTVQIADEVGGAGGVDVNADGVRKLADAAADVERSRKQYSLYN